MVMKSPQDVPRRPTVVVLNEVHAQSSRGKLALLPRFQKEAAWIAEHCGPDENDVAYRRMFEVHMSEVPLNELGEVCAIAGLGQGARKALQLIHTDITVVECDLFRAADLQSLPRLDRLDEGRGVKE